MENWPTFLFLITSTKVLMNFPNSSKILHLSSNYSANNHKMYKILHELIENLRKIDYNISML